MRKSIKTLTYALIALIVVIIAGMVLLTTLINPNKYKPMIIESVKKSTDRELILNGDIKWTFFPIFGLQANQISLSNPPEFGKTNFVNIDSLQVSVQLLSLLYGNLTIDNLNINGLKLNLITNGNLNNWTFKPKEEPNKDTKSTPSAVHIQLDSFNLDNSQFSYVNTKTKTQQKIDNFTLHIKTGIIGGIKFNPEENQLTLKNVTFHLNHIIKGKINLEASLNAKKYHGNIDIPKFSLNEYLQQIGVKKPKVANPQLLNSVAFATKIDGSDSKFTFDNLHIQIGNSNINGQIKTDSISPLSLTENITLDQADVADYSDINGFRLPLKNLKVNGSFNMQERTINAQQSLTIENLTLKGFNVDSFTHQLDNVTSAKIINIAQATTTFNTMQKELKRLSSKGAKNLSQQTNLGHLTAQIVIKRGILTTPVMNLSGPAMITNGRGVVDLNSKTLNYTTYTQFLHNNPLLSRLIFPYHMTGSLSNVDGSLDWTSIQQQVIKYYTDNLPGVTNSIKKAAHKTGAFFKNLFK